MTVRTNVSSFVFLFVSVAFRLVLCRLSWLNPFHIYGRSENRFLGHNFVRFALRVATSSYSRISLLFLRLDVRPLRLCSSLLLICSRLCLFAHSCSCVRSFCLWAEGLYILVNISISSCHSDWCRSTLRHTWTRPFLCFTAELDTTSKCPICLYLYLSEEYVWLSLSIPLLSLIIVFPFFFPVYRMIR